MGENEQKVPMVSLETEQYFERLPDNSRIAEACSYSAIKRTALRRDLFQYGDGMGGRGQSGAKPGISC